VDIERKLQQPSTCLNYSLSSLISFKVSVKRLLYHFDMTWKKKVAVTTAAGTLGAAAVVLVGAYRNSRWVQHEICEGEEEDDDDDDREGQGDEVVVYYNNDRSNYHSRRMPNPHRHSHRDDRRELSHHDSSSDRGELRQLHRMQCHSANQSLTHT
jgi:hypothetical protein